MTPVDLRVITVYLPNTNSTDGEIEEVYEQIDDVMTLVKEKDNLILLCNIDASVGRNVKSRWIGKQGLGKMKKRSKTA